MVALVGSFFFDFWLLNQTMTAVNTSMGWKAKTFFCATLLDTGYDLQKRIMAIDIYVSEFNVY